MKLRNKRTGEIIDTKRQVMAPIVVRTDVEEVVGYSSLAELNEEWEDCTPAEPLIKDEKIRKAVKVWSEAESIPSEETVAYNGAEHSFGWYNCEIMFSNHIQGLEEKEYSINELCGKDEE